MSLQIIRNDITKVKADAIVNTANPRPVIGGGTDKAIYEAAGADKLLNARKKIGAIKPGQAFETPAFDLEANFIIHTVGPVWDDDKSGEREILRNCYINSLELAQQYKCKSIAFPLISSGVYGFPKDVAIDVAKAAINEFLGEHDMKVYLIIFDEESLVASKGAFKKIKELVSNEYVKTHTDLEYGLNDSRDVYRRNTREELSELERDFETHKIDTDEFQLKRKQIREAKQDLSQIVGGKQYNFHKLFLDFLDRKEMNGADVYKGYFDRRIYSKIQSNVNYHPSKGIAIQCCLGLHLTMEESEWLLASGSYAFNMNFDPDIVIMYCIRNQKWKMYEINSELEKYGLPCFDNIY